MAGARGVQDNSASFKPVHIDPTGADEASEHMIAEVAGAAEKYAALAGHTLNEAI